MPAKIKKTKRRFEVFFKLSGFLKPQKHVAASVSKEQAVARVKAAYPDRVEIVEVREL
jgi:hypothetical protein